jgi:hypothetical protein
MGGQKQSCRISLKARSLIDQQIAEVCAHPNQRQPEKDLNGLR